MTQHIPAFEPIIVALWFTILSWYYIGMLIVYAPKVGIILASILGSFYLIAAITIIYHNFKTPRVVDSCNKEQQIV